MPKRILIIEDDKFLRELISRKLFQEGYETEEAVDGEAGLKKIKEKKPDLILLDLILPGLDGFEVLRKIKKSPESASIPVVILSNLGQEQDIEKGLRYGAVAYLVKALLTPGEVVEKIKQILK